MMNDKVKIMVKSVVEENAIKFKNSTSNALYEKINNRLKDEYKNVSKKMFKSLNESAPEGGAFMAGGEATPGDIGAAIAPPSRGTGDPGDGTDGGGGGMTKPDETLPRPLITEDEWKAKEPNVFDFDLNGDGFLDNDELAVYEREVREWYLRLIEIQREWYDYNRRFSERPYPTFRPGSWQGWWRRIRNQNIDGRGRIKKPKPKPRRTPSGTPGGSPTPPSP